MAPSPEFLHERERLVAEVAENLAKLVTSVNQLNRNIETVAVVGNAFAPVNTLWKQFEAVMANVPVAPAPEPQETFLHKTFPAGTDETAALPQGIAPGGGTTVVLASDSEHP